MYIDTCGLTLASKGIKTIPNIFKGPRNNGIQDWKIIWSSTETFTTIPN